jgi:hypothetical protein
MRAHLVTTDFGIAIRDAEDTDFAHPIEGWFSAAEAES